MGSQYTVAEAFKSLLWDNCRVKGETSEVVRIRHVNGRDPSP